MNQSLKRVLTPTPIQAISCIMTSLVVMIALYRDQLWHRIQTATGSVGAELTMLDYSGSLANIVQSPILRTAMIVGFWSAIGLLAYTVVWSLVNVLIEARNEVVLETEYTNRGALWSRLKVPLLQLGLGVALILSIYLSARLTLPLWLDLMSTAMVSVELWQTLVYAAFAILGASVNLYAVIVLGQLVFWVG